MVGGSFVPIEHFNQQSFCGQFNTSKRWRGSDGDDVSSMSSMVIWNTGVAW